MIKKATVRKARTTGYQGKNRTRKGNIYLSKEWIGQRVIVITLKEFLKQRREAKFVRTKMGRIARLSK
jgi:hypothetical protein